MPIYCTNLKRGLDNKGIHVVQLDTDPEKKLIN